ncbi:MAG: hypothetical protein ACNS61_16835 [Candidatus Wenzhouxiangella sp. M2_3B_020]
MFEPRMEVPRPPEPPEQPVERIEPAEPESEFARAVDRLQQGDLEEAEEILVRLHQQRPGSAVVGRLLEQLRKPVEELLPPPYREVRVEPGQTLSEIASEELDDALMFVALARLNDIEVPARLAVGDSLRVPETAVADVERIAPPVRAETDERPKQELTVDDIETVAEYLALSGQPEQARRMLIELIGDRDAPMSSRRLLARLTLEESRDLRQAGAPDAARAILDETLAVLDDRESFAGLFEARERLRTRAQVEQAESAREEGDLVEAYEIALRAAGNAPPDSRAAALAGELRDELIDRYHNDALLAWRDRDVDRAIRLWQTLLDSIPEFEPAQVYLERAKRLRQRLDQP